MTQIVKQNKPRIIPDTERVRITRMGDIVEVQASSMRGKGGKIKRIDKYRFVDTETGEVKHFAQHNRKSRKENYSSLQKTFRNAKEIINTNLQCVEFTTWLTLTYDEKMSDAKQFDKDFETFMKRIRRQFPNNKIKYFSALDFGAKGGFHCHCLLFWDNFAPSFSEEDCRKLWKKGTMFVKSLKDHNSIRNIGAYLTSHLTDMPIEEYRQLHPRRKIDAEDLKTVQTGDVEFSYKKIVKNARLELYPPHFRIFRHSNDMKKPEVSYDDYGTIKEELNNRFYELAYTGTIDIHNEDSNAIISQQYEYYSLDSFRLNSFLEQETFEPVKH